MKNRKFQAIIATIVIVVIGVSYFYNVYQQAKIQDKIELRNRKQEYKFYQKTLWGIINEVNWFFTKNGYAC